MLGFFIIQEEQVAHLYNPLHPAVLRLIQFSVEAALKARIPIAVCGEMAADPTLVVDSSTGNYTFTPVARDGTDVDLSASFDYTVTDNDGDTDSATITINVDDVPEADPETIGALDGDVGEEGASAVI